MTRIEVEAVLWLQEKLAFCEVPYWINVYETALEYATAPSSERKIDQYYRKGLIRDAKKKISRYNSIGIIKDEEALYTTQSLGFPSQEQLIIYTDLQLALDRDLENIHKDAKIIYHLSREGYKTSEIGDKLNLSSSYIRRIKSSIKEAATQICLN